MSPRPCKGIQGVVLNDVVMKDSGNSYTYEALHAGTVIEKTTFTSPTVAAEAILNVAVRNSPTASGATLGNDLNIYVDIFR